QGTFSQIAGCHTRIDVQKDDSTLSLKGKLYAVFFFCFLLSELARNRKYAATLFLDLWQFDIAQKARPACFPLEIEFKRVERHIGMNRPGVCPYFGYFNIADNVNRATFTFDADF